MSTNHHTPMMMPLQCPGQCSGTKPRALEQARGYSHEQCCIGDRASRGIGKAIARLHAERGGDLVVVARSADKLEQLKAELEGGNSQVKVIAKDLTESAAPSEIYDEVKKAGIEIDYLINNAGFGGCGSNRH